MCLFGIEKITQGIASYCSSLNDVRAVGSVCKSSHQAVFVSSGSESVIWKVQYDRISKKASSLPSSSGNNETFKSKLMKLVINEKFTKMKSVFSAKKGQYILLQDIEFPSKFTLLEKNSLLLVDQLFTFLNVNNKNKGHGDRISKCFLVIVRCLITMSQFHSSEKLLDLFKKVVNKFIELFGSQFHDSLVDFAPKHKPRSVPKEKALALIIELEQSVVGVLSYLILVEKLNSANHKAGLFSNLLDYQVKAQNEELKSTLWNVLVEIFNNHASTLEILKKKVSKDIISNLSVESDEKTKILSVIN